MRYFAFVLLAACASGDASGVEDPGEVADLPLGSFCLGDDPATRICLPAADVVASVTTSGDAHHVVVQATLHFEWEDPGLGIIEEDRTIEIEGQVPATERVPRPAERVALSYPAMGTCRSSRPTNPFGGPCGRFDTSVICAASAYDDPAAAALDIVILDEERVAGRFSIATLPFAMPQGECDNEPSCTDAEAPEFWPAEALPAEGLFHLSLVGGTGI